MRGRKKADGRREEANNIKSKEGVKSRRKF